ncbi:hypothetical protein SHIRM173S_01402 [Streptomyces hirsutus]
MALREGGARSVMAAYTETDGVPASADPALLTRLLREEWGFTGTVVADYFGIGFLENLHRVAAPPAEAAHAALLAGIDVELDGQPVATDSKRHRCTARVTRSPSGSGSSGRSASYGASHQVMTRTRSCGARKVSRRTGAGSAGSPRTCSPAQASSSSPRPDTARASHINATVTSTGSPC